MLVLLMDTVKTKATAALREAQEKRPQLIRHLFQRDDVWGGQELEGAVGAFLNRNRVAGLSEPGMQKVGDRRYTRGEFDLEEGYMNPPTAVAVEPAPASSSSPLGLFARPPRILILAPSPKVAAAAPSCSRRPSRRQRAAGRRST